MLQVLPSLNRSAGVSRFVYNMTVASDESRVHYDILHHAQDDGVPHHEKRFDEELEALGHRIYRVDYAGHDFRRFIREVHAVISEYGASYDVVHCHMPNSAFCVLREAKRVGIEHRVLHSHLNSSSDNALHRLRNVPLNAVGKRYATDNMACSEEAGRFLFGRAPFTLMRNGIPLADYAYDSSAAAELRGELGIGAGEPVVGCVGRMVPQKNYAFAVEAFAALLHEVPEAHLVVLGGEINGATTVRDSLVERASELDFADRVHLPGIREDAQRFYSLFDVFFMPSLYEGLPVSAVEAQAAGLPCVYSTGVPAETDIAGTGSFTALDAPLADWARALKAAIEGGRHPEAPIRLEAAGYSAEANAARLMEYYERLVNR